MLYLKAVVLQLARKPRPQQPTHVPCHDRGHLLCALDGVALLKVHLSGHSNWYVFIQNVQCSGQDQTELGNQLGHEAPGWRSFRRLGIAKNWCDTIIS